MCNLSEQIERKYINTIELDDWEIETDSGWHDIGSVSKTVEYESFEIITDNGKSLKAADNHIIFDEFYNEIFVKDSLGKNIITQDGIEKVINVKNLGYSCNMYDLQVDSNDHRFWSSGILSHNSTTIAAYMLHYIMFNENKDCAILANKAAGAREILSRIQMAYELLPYWMKMGVKDWNKGSIYLENGSSIIASATSSSAIRGLSISFLLLDEFAFVPKNMAEDFFRSVYPTISSGKESKIAIISTPFGMNHYYKLWNEASEGKNDYVPNLARWNNVPSRDEAWKKETIKNIGQEAFGQEFECVTGDTLITVLDISTGEIKKISMEDLYFEL